jgi:hypothetical protein
MVSQINGLREFREIVGQAIGGVGRPAPNLQLNVIALTAQPEAPVPPARVV